jgi:hypothetical protein
MLDFVKSSALRAEEHAFLAFFIHGGLEKQGSYRNDRAFVDHKGYFARICFKDPCKGGN